MSTMKKVLTIAGSDSGGGAGIQADLKTFAALGVHGMTAITAVTAQNTLGVTSIQEIKPSTVEDQIEAVVNDIGVDAVKIGMLYSTEIVKTVSTTLKKYGLKPVLDPVMVSASGAQLLKPEAVEALKQDLIPLAHVLTPNVFEAEILSGIKVENVDDAIRAAETISEMGAEFTLIKGGHLTPTDKAVDILYGNGEHHILEAEYHETRNTHGTGCNLSSAIAAFLAKGLPTLEAVKSAKDFVNKAIKNGLEIGKGQGIVNIMSSLYDEAEKAAVLENIREAIAIIESEPKIGTLVAECQMNIGMALTNANGAMDVAAVNGRLTRHIEGVRAMGCPMFGVSRHIASTILAVKEYDHRKRAALNLRYADETVNTCRELGLTVSHYDRREEPEKIKRMEGKTTAWGAGKAVKRAGCTLDVIYHHGDWGKEPMIVLVGESAVEVARWAVKIAREIHRNGIQQST